MLGGSFHSLKLDEGWLESKYEIPDLLFLSNCLIFSNILYSKYLGGGGIKEEKFENLTTYKIEYWYRYEHYKKTLRDSS